MKTAVQQSWAIYFATGVRVVLGIILIAIADATHAPWVFEGFGWFVIVVAALIPILGRTRLEGLMNWFLDKGAGVKRISMGFGVAFGLLIAYGAGVW